jgi:hypothetical protein
MKTASDHGHRQGVQPDVADAGQAAADDDGRAIEQDAVDQAGAQKGEAAPAPPSTNRFWHGAWR